MSVTYQQVQDAITAVDLHHVERTTLVICSLILADSRVVIGIGMNAEGDADFDIARNASRARKAAEDELAKQLETKVAEGAAHGNEN